MAWVPMVIEAAGSVQLARATPAETVVSVAVAHSTEAPSLTETVPVGVKAVTPPPAVTVAVYVTATPKGDGDAGDEVMTVEVVAAETDWVRLALETAYVVSPA